MKSLPTQHGIHAHREIRPRTLPGATQSIMQQQIDLCGKQRRTKAEHCHPNTDLVRQKQGQADVLGEHDGQADYDGTHGRLIARITRPERSHGNQS